MKCHRARDGLSGIFAFASCTRFSPKVVSPSPTASATASAVWFFDTASNVTSAGSRPERPHAAAMRDWTAARFSASGMGGA